MYIEGITCPLVDMNFIFSRSTRYFTSELLLFNYINTSEKGAIYYVTICDVGPENSLDDRNGKTKTNNTENNKD